MIVIMDKKIMKGRLWVSILEEPAAWSHEGLTASQQSRHLQESHGKVRHHQSQACPHHQIMVMCIERAYRFSPE